MSGPPTKDTVDLDKLVKTPVELITIAFCPGGARSAESDVMRVGTIPCPKPKITKPGTMVSKVVVRIIHTPPIA